MRHLALPVILSISAGFASPLSAQEARAPETAGAAADLAMMREKAGVDPQLRSQFQQIEQMIAQRNRVNVDENVLGYIFRYGGMRNLRNMSLDEPVRIATIEALEPARNRAQVVSQVLAADLDGDWQITRDELTESIKYGMIDGAAQAFLIADDNRDDILSTDELKIAIDELAQARFQGGRSMPSIMPVFDFDGDGNLTQEEIDRGVAALKQ